MSSTVFKSTSEKTREKPRPKKSFLAGTSLVCLAIAAFSWLLTSLETNYNYRFPVPVRYENLPQGRVPLKKLPAYFYTDVNASGFSLLALSIKLKLHPLTLDVSAVMPADGLQKYMEIKIPVHELVKNKISELSPETKTGEIFPDSLLINYSERSSKKIPVLIATSLSFAPSCDTSGTISVMPDSVTVFGPAALLDTMKYVNTQLLSLKNLRTNVKTETKLNLPAVLSSEPKSVRVLIPVEQFTEKESEISVEAVHVPSGKRVKIFPPKVKVSYLVPLSAYSKPVHFNVTCDMEGTKETGNGSVKLKITSTSQNIRGIKMNPSYAEYVLFKN